MIPVIFDTNIYGKITIDPEKEKVVNSILASNYTVLNFALIREELRKTAKGKTYSGGKKLRPAMLSIYDQLAANRQPVPVSGEIKRLADEYYIRYKQLGGNVGKKRIINDLRILACASLKNCYTIVSEDSHFLEWRSKIVEACITVNPKHKLRLPGITTYRGLKRIVNVS